MKLTHAALHVRRRWDAVGAALRHPLPSYATTILIAAATLSVAALVFTRTSTADAQQASGERGSFVQLFGPVQNEGSLFQAGGPVFNFPGAPLARASTSTNFKRFWFNRAWQRITWAALRVEWIPNSADNRIRLIHADDGPTNITQIVEVPGSSNTNPTSQAFNVTAAFQALARAGVPKNIGWQLTGNSQTLMRIYQIHLEILEAQ